MKNPQPSPTRRLSRSASFRLYKFEWEELKLIIAIQELRLRRVRVREIARLLKIEEELVRCYLRRHGMPEPMEDAEEASEPARIGETYRWGTMVHINEELTLTAKKVRPTMWDCTNPRFHKFPVIKITAERHDFRPLQRRKKREPNVAGQN